MTYVITTAGTFTLCIWLTACGSGTEEKWQEQYDLGKQYLLELDYEQAVVAFTAAIEIDPNVTDAYLGRAEAYLASGDTEDNLSAALSDYETALELDQSLTDVYVQEADIYIALLDYESALEIVERGQESDAGNADLSEKEEQIKDLIEEQEQEALAAEIRQRFESEYWDELLSIAEAVRFGADGIGWDLWGSDDLREFLSEITEEIYWEMDDGSWLCVYPSYYYAEGYSSFQIYYGGMTDGMRDGFGISFLSLNSPDIETPTNYVYEGEWNNDSANGEGSLCMLYGSAHIHECYLFTFADGLAEGAGTVRITDDEHGTGECEAAAEGGMLIAQYYLYEEDGWSSDAEYAGIIERGNSTTFIPVGYRVDADNFLTHLAY